MSNRSKLYVTFGSRSLFFRRTDGRARVSRELDAVPQNNYFDEHERGGSPQVSRLEAGWCDVRTGEQGPTQLFEFIDVA